MGMEIERKWLLDGERAVPADQIVNSAYIIQAYLYDQDGSSVRVRCEDGFVKLEESRAEYSRYLMAIKSPAGEMSRNELEFRISKEVYEAIIHDEATSGQIDKVRWVIPLDDGLKAEVDIYYDFLDGLVTVEVEFPDFPTARDFVAPDWFGPDVSADPQYFNSEMARTGVRPPIHP